MRTLFLLLMCCHVSSAVKHSLEFFITATYGIQNFTEFVGFAMLDGVSFGHCDGKEKADSKQDWMKKLLRDYPNHQRWYTDQCLDYQHFFRENIDIIMQRLNQTEGIHILQQSAGCEWDDDETGEPIGFNQYGYDGEDFISLDLKTLTWIAPTPMARMTKNIWDTERARLEGNKELCTIQCPFWIRKYLQYRRNFKHKTGNTSVSLLQKSPSSPISCFATGFYPNRAAIFWRKDGEELHEDVKHGDILPNQDETFQMSVDLNISAVKPVDWWRYECVFQLHGVKEDFITKLDKAVIRSNYESPSWFPVATVTVAGVVLLSVCIFGVLKRGNKDPGNQTTTREAQPAPFTSDASQSAKSTSSHYLEVPSQDSKSPGTKHLY